MKSRSVGTKRFGLGVVGGPGLIGSEGSASSEVLSEAPAASEALPLLRSVSASAESNSRSRTPKRFVALRLSSRKRFPLLSQFTLPPSQWPRCIEGSASAVPAGWGREALRWEG